MKKILMISYYFPPMTGVGTKRISHFVNNLPKFGFEPVVLTVEPENLNELHRSYGRVSPETSIKADCKKYYAKLSFLHSGIYKFLRKFKIFRGFILFISIPDHFVFWIPAAYKKAKEVIIKENINIVYSTAPPYSSIAVAYLLKRKFKNLIWISDLRDEWTTNRYIKNLSGLHFRINKYLEKKFLNSADLVVTVTEPILEIIKKTNSIKEEKIFLVENSYPDEFYKIGDLPAKKNIESLVITYTGSFYGKMVPDNLISVLENLIIEGKINKKELLINFIGNSHQYSSSYLDIVNIDYLSYQDLKKYKSASDLLLIILEEEAKNVYTGKIFDYIATGIPVLALVPSEGVVDNLVRQTGSGFSCPLEDKEKIKEIVLQIYQKWKNNTLKITPDWQIINRYSAENTTGRLARLIEGVWGK